MNLYNTTIPMEVISSSLFIILGLFLLTKSVWDFKKIVIPHSSWQKHSAKTIIKIYYALAIGVVLTLSLIYTERNFMADYNQNDWLLFFVARLLSLQLIGYLLFVKGFKMVTSEYED